MRTLKVVITAAVAAACLFTFAALLVAQTGTNAPVPQATPQAEKVRVHAGAAITLDGDTVWKQNCSRCHLAPGAIPRKKVVAVSRHMRDVTPLTDAEYHALLEFLKK